MKALVLSILLLLPFLCGRGQNSSSNDSINFSKLHFTHNKFVNNIFQQAVNSVKRSSGNDTNSIYLNGKSETPYVPYRGKIIRHINIEPYGFNRSFKDTSQRDNSKAAKIGDKLHITTRKQVVRNNLFIKENTPLNPFKLADNERYIRSIEFIQDARIVIDSILNNPDSVDITIYTKDLFSIGASGASGGANHINLDAYDANLLGTGQRIDLTGLYDYTRTPNFGYGVLYRNSNLMGSFIDATAGSSSMIISNYTHQEESTEYVSLTKRLASPYSRYAGGLTISHDASFNQYHIPDSISFPYKFYYFDVWAGYNIGIRKLSSFNNTIRDRQFFSLRYYNRDFTQVPARLGPSQFDPVYNSSYGVLGTFTFFRQDYYKTQYIYGFGTTEDLPYGYNIAVTGGYQHQLTLNRPYTGVNVSDYVATRNGDFLQFYLRTGSFFDKSKWEDASYLVGVTGWSRLFFWNSTKIRQYLNLNYTRLYNVVTYAPLRIDNDFGIRGFLSDSVYGTRRVSLQLETEFYLKYKLFGFQFAPFPWGDLTLITPPNAPLSNSSLYTALGFGVRARNENLIFETIEMRVYFFPVAPNDMRGFKIIINSNIKYRYSSNYINEPDFVQLNSL